MTGTCETSLRAVREEIRSRKVRLMSPHSMGVAMNIFYTTFMDCR